jgi:hypothetical protein
MCRNEMPKARRYGGLLPTKAVLSGCIADKTPHFNLVNRSTFNRKTALAPVEIIIIDLPYPRFDTPQIIGNGILGYSPGSGRCPRPAPGDYRKKYARADVWFVCVVGIILDKRLVPARFIGTQKTLFGIPGCPVFLYILVSAMRTCYRCYYHYNSSLSLP